MEIVSAYESLAETLSRLLDCLVAQHPPCWMAFPRSNQAQKITGQAIDSFADIWRTDLNTDARQTPTHPGIMLVNQQAFDLAAELNNAKARFAQAVTNLDRSAWSPLLPKEIALAFNRQRHLDMPAGYSRLILKAATRKLTMFTERVDSIGFSWSKQSTYTTAVTVKQARMLLTNQDNGRPDKSRLLDGLDENEVLAKVHRLAPRMRANVLFADGKRRTIRGQLPILLLDKYPMPRHNYPLSLEQLPAESPRLTRSDQTIDPEPIVPDLNLHRYLPGHCRKNKK